MSLECLNNVVNFTSGSPNEDLLVNFENFVKAFPNPDNDLLLHSMWDFSCSFKSERLVLTIVLLCETTSEKLRKEQFTGLRPAERRIRQTIFSISLKN